MGYARALLQKDVRAEQEALQKKAKKKGLWGSIGRTIGSLAVMAVSGGTLNPVTLGLLTGAGTLAGGAIGSARAGKLTGGKFFQKDRASLETELGAFGSKNITEALKGAVTAGIGQKIKLGKAATSAKDAGATAAEVEKIRKGVGFGEGLKESFLGKGLQKVKTARLGKEFAEKGWIDPNLQTGAGDIPTVAMDRRYSGPGKFDFMDVGEGASARPPLDMSFGTQVPVSEVEGVTSFIESTSTPFDRSALLQKQSEGLASASKWAKLQPGIDEPWQESLFSGVDSKLR
jgi:hypothetical protein